MQILIALILYPGVVALAASGVLLAFASGVRIPRLGAFASIHRTAEGVSILMSLALLTFGAALLPLPIHPALGRWLVGKLPLAWALIEAAFLLPLLPGLISRRPLEARAASRAAQLGIAGRAVFWIAATAAMLTGTSLIDLPGRLLALVTGLMVLPAAAGLGPFGPEQSLAQAQQPGELDGATQALLPFVRNIQAAVLVLALAATVVPPVWASGAQALIGAGSVIALVLLAGLLLTQIAGRPRLTLPMGLHWCWRRALPLALASLVYVMIV